MANDKPQVWHGKNHRLLWTEPAMEILTTIEDDANSYTYCSRDDVFGYDDDDWEKIKDKIKEKDLKEKDKDEEKSKSVSELVL